MLSSEGVSAVSRPPGHHEDAPPRLLPPARGPGGHSPRHQVLSGGADLLSRGMQSERLVE